MAIRDWLQWEMHVKFDDPETNRRAREWRENVEDGNGLTEAQAFVAHLREHWSLDSEEFDGLAREWIDELDHEVVITSDVWDDYGDILRWLIGATSPRSVRIFRDD